MSTRRRYGAVNDDELRAMGLLYSQDSSSASDNGDYNDFGYRATCENCRDPGNGYRSNDRCKRHRLRDDEPYSENVSGYTRRKPRS